MTFEELSVNADVAKLSSEHPFYKFEQIVLNHLKPKRDHPEEHTAMLAHWNLPTNENDKYSENITVLNGTKNRVWHVLLHYKYWSEAGMHEEMVKELLEEHPELNLGEIPLPQS